MAIVLTTYGSRPGTDGMTYVRADIQSDDLPVQMPVIGAEVDGLDDMAMIDVGSTLRVLEPESQMYIMGQDLEWHLWQEIVGGGVEPEPEPPWPEEFDTLYNEMRPSDWMPIPEPAKNEVIFLVSWPADAAYDDASNNFTIRVSTADSAQWNIDFGKVKATVKSGGVYSSLNDSMWYDYTHETEDGHKQMIGRITADSDIKEVIFSYAYNKTDSASIVEISANVPGASIYTGYHYHANNHLSNLKFISLYGQHFIQCYYNTSLIMVRGRSIIGPQKTAPNRGMFYNCYNLQVLPGTIDMSGATTMIRAFYGCKKLNIIPNILGTENITSMEYTFKDCYLIREVPLINTHNVVKMNSTFSACKAIKNVPKFDTCHVTAMAWMFDQCEALESVPDFDTSQVTNMEGMFCDCHALKGVPFFDTGMVTSTKYMFYNCRSITFVPPINMQSVKNAEQMFSGCESLFALRLIDTSSANDIINIFTGCKELVILYGLDITNAVTVTSICKPTHGEGGGTCSRPSKDGIGITISNKKLRRIIFTHKDTSLHAKGLPISIINCDLHLADIIETLQSLPNVDASASDYDRTIKITGNPGNEFITEDDEAVQSAVDKGWIVVL